MIIWSPKRENSLIFHKRHWMHKYIMCHGCSIGFSLKECEGLSLASMLCHPGAACTLSGHMRQTVVLHQCEVWQCLWRFHPGTSEQSGYCWAMMWRSGWPSKDMPPRPLLTHTRVWWCHRQHNIHRCLEALSQYRERTCSHLVQFWCSLVNTNWAAWCWAVRTGHTTGRVRH